MTHDGDTPEAPEAPEAADSEPTDGADEEPVVGEGSFADRVAALAPPTRTRPATLRLGPRSVDALFGKRAMKKGYSTPEQVLSALRLQYRAQMILARFLPIGELMWLQGSLTTDQLDDLIEDPAAKRHRAAERSLSEQLFGDIAVGLAYCTTADVLDALNQQRADDANARPHRRLGELLVDLGRITEEQMLEVLEYPLDYSDTRKTGQSGKTLAEAIADEDAEDAAEAADAAEADAADDADEADPS